jgi:uncharacterized pyridoxamine 5'-phosphate oxidase family protein
MSPATISYDELKQEFTQQIQKAEHGVLATSEGDRVTAREVLILSDDLKIMCFTAKNMRKYKQMQANKNVALSIYNLQIEGTATLTGHPSDERNREFIRIFKEKLPKHYEFWGPICQNPDSDLGVIVINPDKLTAYKRSPDIGPHLDILNVVTKTATRVNTMEMLQTNYDQF